MNAPSESTSESRFLGIEGGGTRTVALLADSHGKILGRVEAGPANVKLLTDSQLERHFRGIATQLPRPDAMAVGLAGAWAEADCKRIRAAAARVWPRVPCRATNDLETALTAAMNADAESRPQVLIVSGTGSCCYGRSVDGGGIKIGGWGHIIGDKGSGYEIGLRALKGVAQYYDEERVWPELGRRLLGALQLNEPDDLIGWAHAAGKADIARLAMEVFSAAERRERIARDILKDAAENLARTGIACARAVARRGAPVRFVLAGSILLRQPAFRGAVTRNLRRLWPTGIVEPLHRESVWGAVELAKQLPETSGRSPSSLAPMPAVPVKPALVHSTQLAPTEQRNPHSMRLDKLSVADAIELMLREDAGIPGALLKERRGIERAISAITRALRSGGRLFYVGAGTSGRLGVLDASECPATFRTAPELVQGIIAGGQMAIWKSIEGAEDEVDAGARALEFRGVGRRDVVTGIAASGTTPFVWGALREAKRRGATTVLICFNPFLSIPAALRPTIVIAPNLGPEVLTGSTRLKAGTATKVILNMFTTLAMVRVGKVMSNLMVDVNPANAKLRDRAARIVRELTGADYAAAWAALEQSGWVIKAACAKLNRQARSRRPGTSPSGTRR